MTATIQQIFDIAIAHMDEFDADGSTTTENTRDYKNRTPSLVTALYPELFLYDTHYQSRFDADNTGADYRSRPGAKVFTSLTDKVPLDDELALTVMPYGLAAALLADENPTLANFLQARYEELLQKFSVIAPIVKQPADWEPIVDVYGGFSSPIDNGTW